MNIRFSVKLNGVHYCFNFFPSDYHRFYLEDEFIIYVSKVHNHRYFFKAFFYRSKSIYVSSSFRSKTELFSAIQNMLEDELYHVVQS